MVQAACRGYCINHIYLSFFLFLAWQTRARAAFVDAIMYSGLHWYAEFLLFHFQSFQHQSWIMIPSSPWFELTYMTKFKFFNFFNFFCWPIILPATLPYPSTYLTYKAIKVAPPGTGQADRAKAKAILAVHATSHLSSWHVHIAHSSACPFVRTKKNSFFFFFSLFLFGFSFLIGSLSLSPFPPTTILGRKKP